MAKKSKKKTKTKHGVAKIFETLENVIGAVSSVNPKPKKKSKKKAKKK